MEAVTSSAIMSSPMLSAWWFEIWEEEIFAWCRKMGVICVELTVEREGIDWKDVTPLVEMTITYWLSALCFPLLGHRNYFRPSVWEVHPNSDQPPSLGRDEIGDLRTVILRFSGWFWLNLSQVQEFCLFPFGTPTAFGSGSLPSTPGASKTSCLIP